MLYLIITLIIYLIICFGFGNLFNKYLNSDNLLSINLLNGLLFIGLLASLTSFVFPLNFKFELVILLIGFLFSIYFKFWKIRLTLFNCVIIILICFVSSMNAFLYDTFSYYLPTITWLNSYGLVKGLANFDFNLGQTSFWHILQASFDEIIDKYYKINALILMIYSIYSIETKQYKLLLFLPIFFLFAASPSPDLPVFVISILLFSNWLSRNDFQSIRYGLIVSSFLILIKPIAFVFPIFFFYLSIKQYKKFKIEYGLVSIVALLFLFKNLILSGNLLFPLSFGNVPFLTYALPKELYDLSALDGKYMAVSRTVFISKDEIKDLSYIDYILLLLNNLHLSLYLFIGFSIFQLIVLYVTFKKKYFNLVILNVLFLIKIVVFTLISIQYRFILDGFFIGVIILIFPILAYRKSYLILIFVSAFCFVFSKNLVNNFSNLHFLKMITPYSFNKVIKPTNYTLETESLDLFPYKAKIVSRRSVSNNSKPITFNTTLIGRYVYQGYHPVLIDSNNVKKGFISLENDNEFDENAKFLLLKYYSAQKQSD